MARVKDAFRSYPELSRVVRMTRWQTPFGASVRPLRMKYQCISIELRAMGVTEMAPKVQGVVA